MDGSTSAKTMSAELFAVVNIDMLFSEQRVGRQHKRMQIIVDIQAISNTWTHKDLNFYTCSCSKESQLSPHSPSEGVTGQENETVDGYSVLPLLRSCSISKLIASDGRRTAEQ